MSEIHPFHSRGTARPRLICLHCSGGAGRPWQQWIAPFAERFEVHAPSLLGYAGAAPWSIGTPVSLDAEAQALAALLQRERVHLFGHSYGGAVALQMALRWPERVRTLTLYEPSRFALLLGRTASREAGEAIAGVGRRIGMEVLSGRLDAAAQRFVDYWCGDGAWAQLGDGARGAVSARMPKVQADFEALFADRVPAAAYRALAMPVQLIGGSRSPLPSRQVLDVLATHLPNAERTTLAGLGHMGPLDAPARVRAALTHLAVGELAQAA
ncbi:MAG TPA: alpha/beta hydrolase [Burkholderiaceae bacterium]|nr:alpha/beta hydrolase [Burkholderiaceae bacterium]